MMRSWSEAACIAAKSLWATRNSIIAVDCKVDVAGDVVILNDTEISAYTGLMLGINRLFQGQVFTPSSGSEGVWEKLSLGFSKISSG